MPGHCPRHPRQCCRGQSGLRGYFHWRGSSVPAAGGAGRLTHQFQQRGYPYQWIHRGRPRGIRGGGVLGPGGRLVCSSGFVRANRWVIRAGRSCGGILTGSFLVRVRCLLRAGVVFFLGCVTFYLYHNNLKSQVGLVLAACLGRLGVLDVLRGCSVLICFVLGHKCNLVTPSTLRVISACFSPSRSV